MRRGILLLLLALAGCTAQPAPQVEPRDAGEVVAPAAAVIAPALRPPAPANPIGPGDELGFNESGLRSVEVTATAPFVVNELHVEGRDNRPIFLLVYPTRQPAPDGCGPAPAAYRFHSFVNDEGNLLGHAFPEGAYTIALYSERLTNLTLRLGNEAARRFVALHETPPAIGLEVLRPSTRVESVAFPYRAGFGQTLAVENRTLFFSEFRVRTNAHTGQQRLGSGVESLDGRACAGHEGGRDGIGGINRLVSRFGAELPPGDYRWRGQFESNASANPRFDVQGYALSFPG